EREEIPEERDDPLQPVDMERAVMPEQVETAHQERIPESHPRTSLLKHPCAGRAALRNRSHSDRPSFITDQRRFNHHGGIERNAGAGHTFCAQVPGGGHALRHLYGARAASAPSVKPRTSGEDRIDRVLIDLIQPSDYVTWEYFSRQRLLATRIVASRQPTRARVLDIGCGHGALSLTLSESAGFDVVAMDILDARGSSVRAKRAVRDPAAAARVQIVRSDAEPLHDRAE